MARLAMPFPIQSLAQPWLDGGTATSGPYQSFLPDGVDPALAVGGSLLAIMAVLGLADLYQRLCISRFSIGTIQKTRATALQRMHEGKQGAHRLRAGDVVARLIGDAARAKAGMKGFLIHIVTNTVLLIGVMVVLMFVNVAMSQVFLGAFLLVGLVTWFCARTMFAAAHRFRSREGLLANRIQKAWSGDLGDKNVDRLNYKNAGHEAHLTKLQGLCTWGAHLALGAAVLIVVVMGSGKIDTGELESSELLLFLLYAVLLRAPLVKIVRQGARTGKILACAERIVELCEEPMAARTRLKLDPLRTELRLEEVKVYTKKVRGQRSRRLGPLNLTIRAGEKIAIVGRAGSGKTTLLRMLMGMEKARRGLIAWDDDETFSKRSWVDHASQIRLVEDRPSWHRTPLHRLLAFEEEGPLPEDRDALKALFGKWGAARPIRRRCTQWETPFGSSDLSLAEAKAVALLGALRSRASLLLLDDPFLLMNAKKRSAALKQVLSHNGTVLVAMRGDEDVVGHFDRVIELRLGRIIADTARSDIERADALSAKSPTGVNEP